MADERARLPDDARDDLIRSLHDEIARLREEVARRERDGEGLQHQIDRLERDNDRLTGKIDHLEQQLAAARRAGFRQAAPFAKERLQGRGGRPGRRAGAHYGRQACRPRPAAVDGVQASLPELQQYGYDAHVPEPVREAVLEASDAEIADARLDGYSMGYTLLALLVGLIAYWRPASFEKTLSSVIEAGGDTDTNGAVAGALLGARFGLEGIPRRWRNRIAAIRAGRTPMELFADRLLLAAAGADS